MNTPSKLAQNTSACSLIVQRREEYGDLLALHQYNPQRYPYLLESVAKGEQNCRYDILFAFPQQQIQLTPDAINDKDFLSEFDKQWSTESQATEENTLPFKGGWFLYLGYELAQQIEPCLGLSYQQDINFPIAFATRIPAAVIIDHKEACSYIIVENTHQNLVEALLEDIAAIGLDAQNINSKAIELNEIIEDPPECYLQGIRRIKEYILEGDIFQVNLSRAWRAKTNTTLEGHVLYQQLRQANPAPFAGLVFDNGNYVISSSPERLVSVDHDYVQTRPIAGTRPRGDEAEQDKKLSETLIKHPKEIAEHIMLIDLERNDLGRICQPGTVEVDELMCLESYRHVHHIVSNVRGKLKENTKPGEVIRAVFPGGTITGCPKVRCMEIIHELEQEPRGAYTGALGYVNHDGTMDLNILIRTITLIDNQITLRAGAGIVADSDPEMELEESRIKARGLLRAIQNHLD